MGWLQRLFGIDRPQQAQTQARSGATRMPQGNAPQGNSAPQATPQSTQQQSVPPERMGLNGEYDQSGLAKRVALAFDQDPNLDDIDTLFVAQTGSTVVLKGKAPDQQVLSKMVSVARSVNGASAVDTTQVTVG